MNGRTYEQSPHDGGFNRRALLRGGGAVVAASVAALAVNAGDARAAAGDPVVAGQANDAGTAETSLTSAATTSTLAVANTGDHAPLTLTQQDFAAFTPAAGGELENLDGDLYYTVDFGGQPVPGLVFTEFTANQVVTITPQRVLDTRSSGGRANILNPAGNLDSTGRLLGGRTIEIDLSGLEFAAASALCNLTAVSPLTAGYMTLFPGGTKPATSSINFAKGAVIANFAVTGTSGTDTVSLFSNTTSHVLLDITGFNVGSPSQINPTVLGAAATSAGKRQLAERSKAGTLPSWYRENHLTR
jgi:hypothetical protein